MHQQQGHKMNLKLITSSIVALSLLFTSHISIAQQTQAIKTSHKKSARKFDVARQRQKQLTPLTTSQLVRTLRDAHIVVFGYAPSQTKLAMAWAHVGFENGRGKLIWNYNIGNLGPSRDDHYYYRHSRYTDYRAFDGFLDGAIAYWRVVRRCSSAINHFNNGSPRDAAIGLKRCGYYGVEVEHYAREFSSLYEHARSSALPRERSESIATGTD